MLAMVIVGVAFCAMLGFCSGGSHQPHRYGKRRRGSWALQSSHHYGISATAVPWRDPGYGRVSTSNHDHHPPSRAAYLARLPWQVARKRIGRRCDGCPHNGVLVTVVGLILHRGAGTSFLDTVQVQFTVAGSIVAFVLWAIIGAGLGAAIANQTLAIVGVLLFTVFLEPFLRIVAGPTSSS